jgi:hypothetical protein
VRSGVSYSVEGCVMLVMVAKRDNIISIILVPEQLLAVTLTSNDNRKVLLIIKEYYFNLFQ